MVRDRSEPHFGAARLECTGQTPTRLTGVYWTDRLTRGDMEFSQHAPQVLQTFAEAEAHFGRFNQ
jgi:hypothetical protein